MQQYILDQEQIEKLLQGLQTAYGHCKEVQQQYVANLEAHHMESPEMAMEVVEDLENFAHILALLGKQWEELRGLQSMVTEHYLYDMISSLEETPTVEAVADEGVEGYDVGVALGVDFVMAERWQGETFAEKVEPKATSSSFMSLFSNTSETKHINEYDYDDDGEDDDPKDDEEDAVIELTKYTNKKSNLYDMFEMESSTETKKQHKKRCKHCTEDSPIPEERDKCCIVKQEKKKKKEKSKDKSKHKKEAPSVDKWAKKLSKWERYAEEHGDAWTEKVLQKVAKKAEKKAEKRGMKAVFKKHKLDRFAKLSKED